jgi:anaerobic selenocysteine-containing dehydrogenase
MPDHRLRICPLCEATCGLQLEVEGRAVRSVRGDDQDPFSEGYLCPKGVAMGDLDADPDRLRHPLIRYGKHLRKATWDQAFDCIEHGLRPLLDQHGPNSLGLYLGNPTVHNLSLSMYVPMLRAALRTQNVFTASSVDQLPKQLTVGLMFGNGMSVPIPDIDRCQYLLVLGANPLVSNGSLMTVPNVGQRLKRFRDRGGKLVVLDPCRTRTAHEASEHHFIRPGTDALLLFALVHTLFDENLTAPGRLRAHVDGWDQIRELAVPFTPQRVAERCGIDAEVIRTLARELAQAEQAAVYGRIGTCTQAFGTLASWLVEVLHVLTGNLDREGGALFTCAAHGPANTKGPEGRGRGLKTGRWNSRVRGLPEIFGELPVACLAEEILTPGDGQIRAMINIAGNPLLSAPHSGQLAKAWDSLEFLVCLDIYPNETSHRSDVILPGLSPLECPHYDLIFSQLAIHNYARYSPPVFEPAAGQLPEWQTLLRLTGIASGRGPQANANDLDQEMLKKMIRREMRMPDSPIRDCTSEQIVAALDPRKGPLRILDFLLQTGPYGAAFGAHPEGLSLSVLEKQSRGVDLGPLAARIPEVLRTSSGKIELAPEPIVVDVSRLQEALQQTQEPLVLIGRRDLRSNNSWMHNLPRLVSGSPRCTLKLHPNDAQRANIDPHSLVIVKSQVGQVTLPVEITEDLMPGVVSIPHGWGHQQSGQQIASSQPGCNSNLLADDTCLDGPSGNAVLSGIPVTIEAVTSERKMVAI